MTFPPISAIIKVSNVSKKTVSKGKSLQAGSLLGKILFTKRFGKFTDIKRGMIMTYTVGETAKLIGVAPSTLRYYDKEGLLPFVERSGGGVRMFKDVDIECLNIIECLKKTGMPLKDIKTFLDMVAQGDSTIDARLALFQKQRAAVEAQMRELQNTLDVIDYKCWYYETAKKAGTTEVLKDIGEQELPQNLRSVFKKLKPVEVVK